MDSAASAAFRCVGCADVDTAIAAWALIHRLAAGSQSGREVCAPPSPRPARRGLTAPARGHPTASLSREPWRTRTAAVPAASRRVSFGPANAMPCPPSAPPHWTRSGPSGHDARARSSSMHPHPLASPPPFVFLRRALLLLLRPPAPFPLAPLPCVPSGRASGGLEGAGVRELEAVLGVGSTVRSPRRPHPWNSCHPPPRRARRPCVTCLQARPHPRHLHGVSTNSSVAL